MHSSLDVLWKIRHFSFKRSTMLSWVEGAREALWGSWSLHNVMQGLAAWLWGRLVAPASGRVQDTVPLWSHRLGLAITFPQPSQRRTQSLCMRTPVLCRPPPAGSAGLLQPVPDSPGSLPALRRWPFQFQPGLTSQNLCSLMGWTPPFSMRLEPIPSLSFLWYPPSALGCHVEFTLSHLTL